MNHGGAEFDRITRPRSILLWPLVLFLAIGVALGAAQLARSDEDPGGDESSDPETADRLDQECSLPSLPTEKSGWTESELLVLFARSDVIVGGTVTDPFLDDDFSIGVSVERWYRYRGGQNVERLVLPSGTPGAITAWGGARFIAFFADDDLTAPSEMVLFACSGSEPVLALDIEVVQVPLDLSSVDISFSAFGDATRPTRTLMVGPRVRALDLRQSDGTRIGLFMPETLGSEFTVWDLPGKTETGGAWPLVFANDDIVGLVRSGECLDDLPASYCSSPLSMDARLRGTDSSRPPLQMQLLAPSTARGLPVDLMRAGLVIYRRDSTYFALDSETLEPRWAVEGFVELDQVLAVVQEPGVLLVGDESASGLAAIDSDGRVLWKRDDIALVSAGRSPSPSVIVRSTDPDLPFQARLDLLSGAEVWSITGGDPIED